MTTFPFYGVVSDTDRPVRKLALGKLQERLMPDGSWEPWDDTETFLYGVQPLSKPDFDKAVQEWLAEWPAK
jgi:hypothetical protein